MSFSDDDLKRLKECLYRDGKEHWMGLINQYSHSEEKFSLTALLARLEASERSLKAFVDLEADKMSYDTVVSLLSEWRKAAGK
jgi:hypothetical protein